MSTALKDLISPDFVAATAERLREIYPSFTPDSFTNGVFTPEWKNLELKQRLRHLSLALRPELPEDFPKAAEILAQLAEDLLRSNVKEYGIQYMFIPDYLELCGLDHPEEALSAMERITPFTSCEFAIRPFIHKYGKTVMDRIIGWTQHPNHHLRRLASEGSRPRLPWAMQLPAFIKDPSPTLPILEALKEDPSEYVRRSVANHLNDISRDHPDKALSILISWTGRSRILDQVAKHGARTLLKKGRPEVLRLFGHDDSPDLEITAFDVLTPEVAVGGRLTFRLSIRNTGKEPRPVRLEYRIFFLLANGKLSPKVFKISERSLAPGEEVTVEKAHNFRPITTRVYYPGVHEVAGVVNGRTGQPRAFLLLTGD